jgi:hypothetical protein
LLASQEVDLLPHEMSRHIGDVLTAVVWFTGKLQEWTVSSEAASRRLASRAAAIQSAMQQLSSQVLEGNTAADGAAAAGVAARSGATSSSGGGSNSSSGAAAAAAGVSEDAVSAATASVLDQMAGLQQLMQAEAHKHQEVFDSALKVQSISQHVILSYLLCSGPSLEPCV